MSRGKEGDSGLQTVSLFGSPVLQCQEAPVTTVSQTLPPIPDIVVEFRLRNGLCHGCGARVYRIEGTGGVIPLTIPRVCNEGRCLHCYPDKPDNEEHPSKKRRIRESAEVNENGLNVSNSIVKAEPFDEDDRTYGEYSGDRKNLHASSNYMYKSDIGKEITIHDSVGTSYTGIISEGTIFQGRGRFSCSFKKGPLKNKQNTYVGEFKDGKFHGEGTLDDVVKGFVYKGSFFKGAANGHGTGRWGEVWNYKGEWVNGRREGQGILSQDVEGGEVYNGEWKDDSWHGHGELRFNGGGCYVGEFRDHKIEGKGRYVFSDGSVYEGTFKNDFREGHGTMWYEDGSIYEGEWRNNWREGNGSLDHGDGSVFRGIFRGDSKVSGVLHLPDGILRREKYVNGVLQN